jgi:cardiolipin synthase
MVLSVLKSAGQPPHRRFWMAVCVLGLLGTTACNSLPTIVPDLALPSGPPPQLEGSGGPLSAAQSKAILSRLAKRGQDTDIFARHLAIEEAIVGSPLTTGNQVLLLQDGPATYRAMYAAILAAQDHINMETYILDDDEVGQRFVHALIAKQRQGVQVNLIRDSVGTLDTPAAFFKQLTDNGIRVLEFNPINPLSARKEWELNQRDHRKLLIVDGRTAFLGGINISGVYSGGSFRRGSRAKPSSRPDASLAWRDTDLQLRGPVVAELQKLFLTTWENQKGAPLAAKNYFPPPENAGQEVVRVIGSSPDEPYSLIYATLLSAIACAETSVHLTNAYFAPDPQLLEALEAAANAAWT